MALGPEEEAEQRGSWLLLPPLGYHDILHGLLLLGTWCFLPGCLVFQICMCLPSLLTSIFQQQSHLLNPCSSGIEEREAGIPRLRLHVQLVVSPRPLGVELGGWRSHQEEIGRDLGICLELDPKLGSLRASSHFSCSLTLVCFNLLSPSLGPFGSFLSISVILPSFYITLSISVSFFLSLGHSAFT